MKKPNILIVEDEIILAESVKRILIKLGYEVLSIVSTGENALRKIKEERPDLILMDIKLQGKMDGIEAAEKIRAKYRIPIIYTTAYADDFLIERAKITTPYGYLVKPFSTKELHSNIEMALTKNKQDRQIEHLNRVLQSIRKVNQIITMEHDREKLLTKACECLVETRGYRSAWLALLDDRQRLICFSQKGLGNEADDLLNMLKKNSYVECIKRAFKQHEVIIIENPALECSGCPLLGKSPDTGTMTISLQHRNKSYGIMSVNIEKDIVVDDRETDLFKEVADDIAFALNNIELEEKRKLAEEALRISEAILDAFFRESPVSMNLIDDQLRYVKVNRLAQERIGLSLEEIVGKPIHEVAPKFAGGIVPGFRKILETGQPELGIEVNGELASKPGVTTHWLSYHFPITMSDGRIWGIGVIANDITERKQAEEELQKRLQELEIYYNATIGREERIIELKQQVNELLIQLSKEKKYDV